MFSCSMLISFELPVTQHTPTDATPLSFEVSFPSVRRTTERLVHTAYDGRRTVVRRRMRTDVRRRTSYDVCSVNAALG